MRKATKTAGLFTLATVALLGTACGAVGANDQQAAAETGDQRAGFFDTILNLANEPIEVPAGTTLSLQLLDTLSSHQSSTGTAFSAEVTQEVSVDGRVAIPVGARVHGHVTEAHPAKKIGGRAILSLAFDELSIANGETIALAARLSQSGKSQVGKDSAIISGSTIGGAVLGEALHEGEGGTVGAVVGAIGGTIGALKTKGKPVVLSQGSTLHITLERPITVDAGR